MVENKVIGRVLSIDNFRVYIKIEENIHGAYKSGINDIYEVARINSYLIIPVGADRIVALITRVTMKEEFEFDKGTSNITLPTSARYILATMLGTIRKKGGKEEFVQGIYSFPILDNPVWYVTEKDLRQIFDDKKKEDIIYDKDYYLPIGKSPAFSNYTVKICPDQLFAKHTAILGNTGSGKSCTLTSIIRNLFKFSYKDKEIQNAHIIIFDTNGEYKDAFLPDKKDKINPIDLEQLNLINAYYYGGDEKVQVPYWLMNWNDFRVLLRPGEGSQAPILNRAIGLAKNEQECKAKEILPTNLKSDIESILNSNSEELKKRTWDAGGSWKWKDDNEIIKIGKAVKVFDVKLGDKIEELANSENFNDTEKQQPIRSEISKLYNEYNTKNIAIQITSDQNIDLPIWFSYHELCTKFLDEAISLQGTSNNKIAEFVSTLRLRMNSFLNDKRMAIPLMLKDNEKVNKKVLPQFLSLLLGDYNRFFSQEKDNNYIKKYNDTFLVHDKKKTSQVMIVDVSQLPFEVLETVTALLGRIILEFVSNFMPSERGKYPIVIVLEEAQNYIAENSDSIAKTVFERIAREGRKYGISLIVSSQRPSELSKTVLSQCNSFIIHRLQNPDDQKYVRGLISSASADILDQLPVIPQQHAIITGDCVRTPIQVRIDDVAPTPNSHNPKYVERWLSDDMNIPYNTTCEKWTEKVKTSKSE